MSYPARIFAVFWYTVPSNTSTEDLILQVTKPTAWPIGNRFLVKADESEKETEAGIILTVQQPKFTGTVIKMPYGVEGFDTIDGEAITQGVEMLKNGSVIREGSRIQWSNQTCFALPVTISVDDEEVDFLLFTVKDVDLVLPE